MPPSSLLTLSENFAEKVQKKLALDLLLTSSSKMRIFATPRRIGFQINNVRQKAENSVKQLKLLPKKVAFHENGDPTDILKKKIISIITIPTSKQLTIPDRDIKNFLERKTQIKTVGKQEYVYCEIDEIGIQLEESLQLAVVSSLKSLPISKVMTYQNISDTKKSVDIKFVRPAHKLVALHGENILKIKTLELTSGQFSDGHRFLGEKEIKISNADDYEKQLQETGKVIPNFELRKAKIKNELDKKTDSCELVISEDLLNEITALCEWPTVYEGYFDKEFLNIPDECLTLTMQKNQKFVPLKTKENQLSNKFLIVSNIYTHNPKNIIEGNERVLKARLSDAQFFFNLDKKKNFEDSVKKLSKVIYHNKLGNYYDRTLRLVSLTSKWGNFLGLDKKLCERAALLSKADLTSRMVDEFPELQGIMGKYYAKFSGENTEICSAIEEHYKPKFSGDLTSKHLLGNCLSLADRMESIVGLWTIGIIPTGEKDPMGLRRNAIAILRILIENKINLNLDDLILDTEEIINEKFSKEGNFNGIKVFFLDRLKNFLKEKGYQLANIESAVAKCSNRISELPERLKAINHFLTLSTSYDLCSTNKRIKNILKKNALSNLNKIPDPNLFQEDAELLLFKKLNEITSRTDDLLTKNMYKEVLLTLTELKHPVDIFFQKVLVNTDNEVLKENRLLLLNKLNNAMNQVAEISHLVE